MFQVHDSTSNAMTGKGPEMWYKTNYGTLEIYCFFLSDGVMLKLCLLIFLESQQNSPLTKGDRQENKRRGGQYEK